MAKFIDTDAGEEFIASARSRETSREIMEAIAYFARDLEEAESVWEGDGLGKVCHLSDIWERVTHNGIRNPEDFYWGASGPAWWRQEACRQEVE